MRPEQFAQRIPTRLKEINGRNITLLGNVQDNRLTGIMMVVNYGERGATPW